MLLDFLKELRKKPTAVAVTVFAAFGGFLYGYDTGTISGISEMNCFTKTFGTKQNDGNFSISQQTKALFVSILSAGTFFGALLGFPSSDFLGRRWGVILACLIFSIGVACQTRAQFGDEILFIIGRVIAGIGIGIISSIIPMYQSECAPKFIRGAMVSTYQWFITIGLLTAAIVNNATKCSPGYQCYQIPIGIQIIFGAILALGMYFLPESPRFLVLKGRFSAAYQSQAKLTSRSIDDPLVKQDVQELIDNTELMKVYGNGTYADCFKMGLQKNRSRTLVGIFLQAWSQLTGINFIFYYGTTFFRSAAGNPVESAYNNIIIVNVVNVVMTIPGVLLIDRLGRRKILIIGAIGMIISEYIIAIIGVISSKGDQGEKTAYTVFVCIYIGFFASTWGPTCWVIIGELYPISIRAKAVSLATASNWLFNFLLGFVTPYMMDEKKNHGLGLGPKVFFIWGTTCVCCLLFAIFCIWETKGLSLEQVNYLVRNSSPKNSAKLNEQLKRGIIVENDMDNDDPFTFSNRTVYGTT